MLLPTVNEFHEAIQNPAIRFKDPRLKTSKVEKHPDGKILVRSGGFALTYRLENAGHRWAVRCFHKMVKDRESRYARICQFISTHQSDILIPVEYKPDELLIQGKRYPVVIMDWVEGDTLSQYLFSNIRSKGLLDKLPIEFVRVVSELERLGIAHGDLSHLNILVRQSKMILIDYDGLFLPEFCGQMGAELGSPNFQHPRRAANDFNARVDRFSEMVIYLSLKGISLAPYLYQNYAAGAEGLLFRRDDFLNPSSSKILKELEQLPGLSTMVAQFRRACLTDVASVPSLKDFLSNQPVVLRQAEGPVVLQTELVGPRVMNAASRGELIECEGEFVTVIGKVESYKDGVTKYDYPFLFLSLGNWRQQCFTIVMWSEVRDLFLKARMHPEEFVGQWVSVTGLLATYVNPNWGARPQIIINSPTDMVRITAEQAKNRLYNSSKVIQVQSISDSSTVKQYIPTTPSAPIPAVPAPTYIPSSVSVPSANNTTILTTPSSPDPIKKSVPAVQSVPQTKPAVPASTTMPASPTAGNPNGLSLDNSSALNRLFIDHPPANFTAASQNPAKPSPPVQVQPLINESLWEKLKKIFNKFRI